MKDNQKRPVVKQKIAIPDWPSKIRGLRETLGRLTQAELAARLGVNLRSVQRWEQNKESPDGSEWIALGKLAGDPDCWEYFEMAGLSKSDAYRLMPEIQAAVLDKIEEARLGRIVVSPRGSGRPPRQSGFVAVPLLADSAAAGQARIVRDKDIEGYVPVPVQFVPHPLDTRCIRVKGDSMEPILKEGYIIAVDASVQDPRRLHHKMVVAMVDDGVTIKWLDRFGEQWVLTPENKANHHQRALGREDRLIGRVAWWHGHQE